MSHPIVLAHGFASRSDLPLPFGLALAGAGTALVVSFVVLAVAWKSPRLRGAEAGVALPGPLAALLDSPAARAVQRALGTLAFLYCLVSALGSPDDALNPAPDVVYVLLWVGLPVASLVLGPIGGRLSPIRALHAGLASLARIDPREGLRPLPEKLGHLPAAVGLAGFVWLELVAPNNTSARLLGVLAVLYVVAHTIAALVYGERWLTRGESFEVYSALVGRLSVLGRRADGALVVRSPLDGLAATPACTGLVAVVAVLLGSTLWDSAAATTALQDTLQTDFRDVRVLVGTLGLFLMIALVAAAYSVAVPSAAPTGVERSRLPLVFAHSLIPIVAGYVVAHYATLLIFEGQRAVLLLSDPLGTGADLFGVAGSSVDYQVVTPYGIALLQVLAIVIGHVLAVISAHDAAVSVYPGRGGAVREQLPLLVLMIAFTCGGIGLLFAV